MSGKNFEIVAHQENTVKQLKSLIDEYPPDQQLLIFAGIKLEDDKTLKHYNIKDDSNIHLVLKLKGC